MKDSGDVDPRDPNLGRIIRDLWDFNSRLAKAAPQRGVRKFRSIEELNAARDGSRKG